MAAAVLSNMSQVKFLQAVANKSKAKVETAAEAKARRDAETREWMLAKLSEPMEEEAPITPPPAKELVVNATFTGKETADFRDIWLINGQEYARQVDALWAADTLQWAGEVQEDGTIDPTAEEPKVVVISAKRAHTCGHFQAKWTARLEFANKWCSSSEADNLVAHRKREIDGFPEDSDSDMDLTPEEEQDMKLSDALMEQTIVRNAKREGLSLEVYKLKYGFY
jgi:hypothetical protein